MGVALYPAFERDVAGFDPSTAMSGKALARAAYDDDGELEKLAVSSGVTPILAFYCETTAEAFEKIGEPVPADLPPEDPLKWSESDDGLRTVDALLASPNRSGMPENLIADLTRLREVLLVAKANGVRFRLRIDI
jgi:hypothetical protein